MYVGPRSAGVPTSRPWHANRASQVWPGERCFTVLEVDRADARDGVLAPDVHLVCAVAMPAGDGAPGKVFEGHAVDEVLVNRAPRNHAVLALCDFHVSEARVEPLFSFPGEGGAPLAPGLGVSQVQAGEVVVVPQLLAANRGGIFAHAHDLPCEQEAPNCLLYEARHCEAGP